MKKIALTGKTDADLRELLKEKREHIRSLRFGIAGSKTRNVKEGRTTKKDVARILTELQKRANTKTS